MGISDEHLRSWRDDGVVLMEAAVAADLDRLRAWAQDLERAPGTDGGILQYDERTPDGGTRRCRTENFVPFHDGLRDLLTRGVIPEAASALLGGDAVLYKEKLNYKGPGGAGYAPHQDAPAYPFVRNTIACMVAIDDATVDNGCLEIVRGAHHEPLPTDERGCIAAEVAAGLDWEPLPVAAGSLLWFHCYVPHRSGPNASAATRRAIYLTYNSAADGDLRGDYYATKRLELRRNPERLSMIGHFSGAATPVVAK